MISEYESTTSTKAEKIRKSKYPDIDTQSIDFVSNCNSIDLTLNTILLKEKANEIAANMKLNQFECSNGFIDRFKRRHSVVFEVIHGEAQGVPED